MSPNLHKILNALTKELTAEVTKQVTEQLRKTYVQDITSIVKSCLADDQLIQDSVIGYKSIEDLTIKYKVSRQTVQSYIKDFGIERKRSCGRKLVNEKQFLDAMQKPREQPKFLKELKNTLKKSKITPPRPNE